MTSLKEAVLLQDEVRRDPILLEYARRGHERMQMGLPNEPLSRPEDVLGERAMIVLDLAAQAATGTGAEFRNRDRRGTEPPTRAALLRVATLLYRADPYLWLSDVRQAAGTQDVPAHTFAPESVPRSMWWTWDVDLVIDDQRSWVGILWVSHGHTVETIALARDDGGGERSGTYINGVHHYPRGYRYPDDHPDRDQGEHVKAELALLSFLNSPYIPKVESRIDRRLRKSLERAGASRPSVDQTVHFIDLRSPDPEPNMPKVDGAGMDYRHRWLVRGHHRAQWYPSLNAHKVIWISPYVKGPEGAPMLVPAYRVAR